ncbi:tRNA dihydrouridine synthase DusB [Methanolobus sp. ZRKC3]|uniref:tRNA dihydrouridine synthase DusB n=1 Tax=Methanolobus sp. ZRKC3 TaxID=3125786 RepID=UPI003248E35E
MRIAKLKLEGNIFLAPMSNVTNLPFRLMCREYGASMSYTEMISSDAVIHENKKTINRGISCEAERPFGIQIFGNSPDIMRTATLKIEESYHPDIIDVNFGCPARLLTKEGCGSALLHSPDLIYDILKELVDNISTPVTAKIRVLEDMDKTLEIARIIEKSGASAITVHGRTRQQQYSGRSNMEYAKRIKRELSIPVIANGDIVDELSAESILEYTECDGIMIGRAAMGNPFLLRRISHYISTGELLEYNECQQRVEDFKEYVRRLEEYDLMHTVNMKAQAQWFTRSISGGRHTRNMISASKDVDEIVKHIKDMCNLID